MRGQEKKARQSGSRARAIIFLDRGVFETEVV